MIERVLMWRWTIAVIAVVGSAAFVGAALLLKFWVLAGGMMAIGGVLVWWVIGEIRKMGG